MARASHSRWMRSASVARAVHARSRSASSCASWTSEAKTTSPPASGIAVSLQIARPYSARSGATPATLANSASSGRASSLRSDASRRTAVVRKVCC
ncbi:MAG: hypothetical protein Q8K79_21115 [Solirubrobacteraceae bacterium]|nr:hypothetical protein [Solirubrobacteraceae bacterium]